MNVYDIVIQEIVVNAQAEVTHPGSPQMRAQFLSHGLCTVMQEYCNSHRITCCKSIYAI